MVDRVDTEWLRGRLTGHRAMTMPAITHEAIAACLDELDKARAEVARMRPVVCGAIALAERLSEDDRCDEEQEDLLRLVRDYGKKTAR